MSMSKHAKSVKVQIPATRAPGKLASFAASNPPSTAGAPVTPEKPVAAVVAMDQLSTEFAKQRTSQGGCFHSDSRRHQTNTSFTELSTDNSDLVSEPSHHR